MKIKLDENMPFQLAAWLRSLGHDADSVQEEEMSGASDETIWQRTQREGRFFITMDLDFSDTRHFEPGKHAGLLLMRVTPGSRLAIVQRVRGIFEELDVEQWRGCFVVASASRLRILFPPEVRQSRLDEV